jgi:glycosyltransferase involved in cell wall biosynthesis
MSETLSILVPVYNEEKTVYAVLESLNALQLPNGLLKELIIVNDGSTDNTQGQIESFIKKEPNLNVIYYKQNKNKGKGAALHTAIAVATGDYIIIQDADMEYDVAEYTELLAPLLKNVADVVYGSRFIGNKPHRTLYFWHYLGNRMLTLLTNLVTNINLSDMETCFKVFRSAHLKSLKLRETRFGFEPEVTIKIARIPFIRIYEVGISYYGRTYDDGKKIRWTDGLQALWCIAKYGLFKVN